MPAPDHEVELAALAAHMTRRRDTLLRNWRAAVTADPTLTTGNTLPRAQLDDHIPALLVDFERRLVATAGAAPASTAAEGPPQGDAAAHGLHRWQQGFDLAEVARELGRLNECVVHELDSYDLAQPPQQPRAVMAAARRIWAQIYSVAISASTSQYFRLQQIEATSHIRELELALESLRELEQQRATLWQQAAHDLRGNLGVVVNATAGLAVAESSEGARAAFLRLLDRNVDALHRLLDDVTTLARLQGGHEQRRVAPLDAAPLLRELCEGLRPQAEARQLFLKLVGPDTLAVEGDAVKIRRITQNLVLNAIKYTRRGGITVSWKAGAAPDSERWVIEVADTGPGISGTEGSALAGAIGVASEQSRQVAADARSGAVSHIADTADALGGEDAGAAAAGTAGEGIGLSIVKRLCDLLDASVELSTHADVGTTFRILLPQRYTG